MGALEDAQLAVARKRVAALRASGRGSITSQSLPAPTNAEGQAETTQDVGPLENVGRAVARDAAGTAGFLGDIVLGAGQLAGELLVPEDNLPQAEIDAFDERFDATDAFEKMLNGIGVRTDPVEPDGPLERLAVNVAAPLASGQGVLQLAKKTTGAAGQALQKNFGRFARPDAVASAAGGVVKSGAQALGVGDTIASSAELVTNLIAGGFADKAEFLREAVSEGGLISRTVKTKLNEFKEREKDTAAEFVKTNIRQAGENPLEVAENLQAPAPFGADQLTSGARSGSLALQSMENNFIRNDPAAADQFANAKVSMTEFIANEMRKVAGGEEVPQAAIDAYLNSADWRIYLMEKRLQQAADETAKFLDSAPDEFFDFSSGVKKHLQDVEVEARAVEKEFWGRIGTSEVSMNPILRALDDIEKERKIASRSGSYPSAGLRDDILRLAEPEDADEVIQILDAKGTPLRQKGPEPVADAIVDSDEVLELRSRLLEEARIASANEEKQLSRRLYQLADSTLDSLRTGSQEFVEASKDAREFSLALNDRFSRDIIAPLLAKSRRGGERIPGNELMETLFQKGPAGETNMKALKLASGGEVPPQAISDILQRFYRRALDGDELQTGKAENFASQDEFGPLLTEAGLKPMIDKIIEASKRMDVASDESAQLAKVLGKDGLNGDIEEFSRLLVGRGGTGDDLVDNLSSMFKSPTGNAQNRLSTMFSEIEEIQNATPEQVSVAINAFRHAVVQGALKSMYRQDGDAVSAVSDTTRRIQNALEASGRYTKEQIDRMGELGELVGQSQKSENQRIFKGQSNTPQDLARAKVMEVLLRFAAVRVAAPVIKGSGPGSLTIAGQAGKLGGMAGQALGVENSAELISMAIFDQDLMTALLTRGEDFGPKQASIVSRALRSINKVAAGFGKSALQPSQVGIVEGLPEDFEREQEDGQ